jgi:hypothetical protein
MTTETVLIEILDSHGRVQSRERGMLTAENPSFTIGRSVNADVTVDDPHVAAMHASVTLTPEGKLLASDLGSVNGIVIAGKRHRRTANADSLGEAQNLELTDGLLQVGRTRLRVRTAHETLAPEKPDQLRPASILHDPAWIAGIGLVAGAAQLIYSNWLGAPRDLATLVVTTLISAALGASAWIAAWALLSRVILGEWRWLRHAAIFLGIAAIFVAIEGLLELAWFTFSLPQWSTRAAWVGAVAFGCALYFHLTQASNITARRAALVACIVPALSGASSQWLLERNQAQNVNHIGTSLRVYPPSLRLGAAGTLDDYLKDATALRDAADKKRKTTPADEEEGGESDEE